MIVFSQYVERDLLDLVDVLIDEGYIYSYPFAVKYVDELIDYIEGHINYCVHKKAPDYFQRYGNDLKYMTYNSNNHTTWYILFEEHKDVFFIKYITNNKYEGHYFNVN